MEKGKRTIEQQGNHYVSPEPLRFFFFPPHVYFGRVVTIANARHTGRALPCHEQQTSRDSYPTWLSVSTFYAVFLHQAGYVLCCRI